MPKAQESLFFVSTVVIMSLKEPSTNTSAYTFDTKLKEWKQMRVYNSVDMESEVFAIHSRRSSSPESLASGRDVSDEVNEGTGKCNLAD